MNIILLIIDTLRYDHIGANGNDWIETPNLDALAARSWVFDRAYAASYPTIPHRTDVITGDYGSPFNPWKQLAFDAVTLPRLLAEEGYATQLIHDTPHLVNGGLAFDYPFAAWTFIRGAEADRPWIDNAPYQPLANWARDELFDHLGDPSLAETRQNVLHTYVRANRGREREEDWNVAKLFNTGAKFVRDNAGRDNFFLWLDCFDPHEPWDSPPEYVLKYDKTPGYDGRIDPRAFLHHHDKNNLSPALIARHKAMYAAKVSWMDRWLGELLAALDESGLSDSTALVVTSDHGTTLNERPGFGKRFPAWESEGHVPLMISAPGCGTGRSDMFVQPQDIFATILGLAGAERPANLDCHDVLALAEAGASSPRQVALTGRPLHLNQSDAEAVRFTVFGEEAYLEWAPRIEACRLRRYGATDDFTSESPGAVESLWQAGLDEVCRRNLPPAAVKWMRAHGEGELPPECLASHIPAGWQQYWGRYYRQWH